MTVRYDTRAEAAAALRNEVMAAPDSWQAFHFVDHDTGLAVHFEPTDDRRHSVRVAWLREADGTYVRRCTLLIWPEHTADLTEGPKVYAVPDRIALDRLLVFEVDDATPIEWQCQAVA